MSVEYEGGRPNHTRDNDRVETTLFKETSSLPESLLGGLSFLGLFSLPNMVFSLGYIGAGVSTAIAAALISIKRLPTSVGLSVCAVAGLGGFGVGAASGHFVQMDEEQRGISFAAQQAKTYRDVPVVTSLTRTFTTTASDICANETIAPVSFPNQEVRKLAQNENGKQVAVQCQPPRFTPTR